ncbi:Xaa-Pro dipeptidase [Providencia stuartii]|nr:Xaa-Pro dipeptidase [Providencia stuartii]
MPQKAKVSFAALVADMNKEQLALIDTIKAGVRYTDYHVDMHHRIAKLLKKHSIIKGISEETMVEQGLTTPFLPHGLGHPLGLQVHDAAGFMQDEDGTLLAAPKMYPFLRCTRVLEPRMVLTIEPGLLFYRIVTVILARRANLLNTLIGKKLSHVQTLWGYSY